MSIQNTVLPKIYRLEITARVLGASLLLSSLTAVVLLILSVCTIVRPYYCIGFFGGTTTLFFTNYILLSCQSKIAKANHIDLSELYGKNRLHEVFVEPMLSKVQKRT